MSAEPRHHEDPNEFLVVGGGIGGLSAALALTRAGRPVRVLEKAEAFTEVGAGLQLAPNATRLLDRLGVLDAALELGVVPARLVLADARSGEGLLSMDVGQRFQRRYGAPYMVMHRSDLLSVLLEACRDAGVALESHREVVKVCTDEQCAHVETADGSSYDVRAVVAADGLRSALRGGFSDDKPGTEGFVAYRGALPVEDVERPFDMDAVISWMGPNLHLVQYPIRHGEMYNQVAVFKSDAFDRGETDWGSSEELEEKFSAMCSPVRNALGSLSLSWKWNVYYREPIERWTHGRVGLLGDAAHPMRQYLAQGACQAIEDAVTLAVQLQRHDPVDGSSGAGDLAGIERAFAAYESIRAPRTARVQTTAKVWGDIWHVDGVGALLRNELMRKVDQDDFSYADWLWRWTPPGT